MSDPSSALDSRRALWSWALYDWANSAFATAVIAGFFPIFFKQFWSAGSDVGESTLQLGTANAVASLLILLSAPLLGALADGLGQRKRFLLLFTALGVVMTALLPLLEEGAWPLAIVLFVIASLGFSGSNIFYDALLVFVALPPQQHRASALGFALGYLGGGLFFAFAVWMTLDPVRFGLISATEAVQLSFFLVALWWAFFTLPLLFWVKEPARVASRSETGYLRQALREVAGTIREIRQQREILLFLLAYWCYIDGVDTIIRMAVDYGLSLGFTSESLITALLLTQFVGFPAALFFGVIGERYGARTGIYLALGVYIGVVLWAYWMNSELEFYLMAAVIGLVQGGIQSLRRSYYARLIPAQRSGEIFGFYNMLGKFAAILGPLLVGLSSYLSGDSRLSILTLLPLFVVGGWLLSKVEEPAEIKQKVCLP
ncbi:MAG: MFS transporter [Gammaproteobacteria bacterium]|nr:MFS transporter [Gammaproteobacteria bacterium]